MVWQSKASAMRRRRWWWSRKQGGVTCCGRCDVSSPRKPMYYCHTKHITQAMIAYQSYQRTAGCICIYTAQSSNTTQPAIGGPYVSMRSSSSLQLMPQPPASPQSAHAMSSSSPPPSAGPPLGRSMAAAMGMGADWDRVLSYIPPSRLATAEQQQRLLSMQMSMMMGVKTMQRRQPTTNTTQIRHTRPVKEERKEEEDVDDSELVDEEGDDEEIRAMKAELRQLRAEKTTSTSTATQTVAASTTFSRQPPPPKPQPQPAPSSAPSRFTDSDLTALVDQLTVPATASLDDPD